MERERNDIQKEQGSFRYWFYSEGPSGKILKAAEFQYTPEYGRNVFNIAFGDWDEATGKLNDRAISNNGDHLRVLHSVAEAGRKFINLWPDAIIRVAGNTSARTRLYQMGIASFWKEISQEVEIWGKTGEEWESFRKGVNYKEFLIFKRIM